MLVIKLLNYLVFLNYLGLKIMPKTPTFPTCFDEVKQISIVDLKRLGYLKPGKIIYNGGIRWTCRGESTGSIGIDVDAVERYARLHYNVNGKSIDYRVELETLPSNLGKGVVWYFICPATGKRCRKLYGIGDYFYSRFAYPDAMYDKQTSSKKWRDFQIVYEVLDMRRDFLKRPYAKPFYNGKPTKRFQRILDREGKFDTEKVRVILNRI